ncbi:MAG: hypothetical protein JWO84_354 [Parcubacteria group bacterium]|nr:hypothetical protein [Parcubacteria group bacterium]
MKRALFTLAAIATLASPLAVYAQDATQTPPLEQEYLEKARVLDASISRPQPIGGTSVTSKIQDIQIQVLDGVDTGRRVSFSNDYTQVHAGEIIYVRHTAGGFGVETWAVADPYRLDVLLGLFGVFLVLLILFGGLQGIRGLMSLGGSLVLIFSLLLPGIYAGHSAILVAIGVSSLIIIVGSYITHGFNRTTTAAVFAMVVTVIITGLGAYYVVHAAQLSGFTSEENVYLNFNTGGKLDMIGLLFGGIMIGLLGVLYDIAIGQAIAVEELLRAGTEMTKRQVYRRALRIGREHIGALINTLAIAYVGTALPLLLLFHDSTASIPYMLNSELFATEIVRVLIGSIGLILAVPITTAIATYFIRPDGRATGHAH